jgi:hypothetical protein
LAGVVVVGGVVVDVAPVQTTLFRLKLVGLLLVPVQVPLKPMQVEAPVPRLPFQLSWSR